MFLSRRLIVSCLLLAAGCFAIWRLFYQIGRA
ncbi:hypothetical protein, partial [Salmonella enterica]